MVRSAMSHAHAQRDSGRRSGDAASADATRARCWWTAARSSSASSRRSRRSTDDILIVGGRRGGATALRAVSDRVPGCGPLGGLHAALTAARGDVAAARRLRHAVSVDAVRSRTCCRSPATRTSSCRRPNAAIIRCARSTRAPASSRSAARLADRRLKMRELVDEHADARRADRRHRAVRRSRSAARQREHAGRLRGSRGASRSQTVIVSRT